MLHRTGENGAKSRQFVVALQQGFWQCPRGFAHSRARTLS
jgi:hypothetical protein